MDTARRGGFLNTVVTTAPQVTATWPDIRPSCGKIGSPAAHRRGPRGTRGPARCVPIRQRAPRVLTAAELRVLKLLPTSTYPQMAASLDISRNTVKTHLRSVYQKSAWPRARRPSSGPFTCACSKPIPPAARPRGGRRGQEPRPPGAGNHPDQGGDTARQLEQGEGVKGQHP